MELKKELDERTPPPPPKYQFNPNDTSHIRDKDNAVTGINYGENCTKGEIHRSGPILTLSLIVPCDSRGYYTGNNVIRGSVVNIFSSG